MRILLSNDDGVMAPGLQAMYQELKKIGEVAVVAPLEERSTTGHSLTLHKPLRLHEIESTGFFGVSGSPADCIYLGIHHVFKGLPDLVVSGINRGANLGQDIYYSGTVSAAREACILGVPALAVSLDYPLGKVASVSSKAQKPHFQTAARVAAEVLKKMGGLQGGVLPRHTLLNLNVPDLPKKEILGIQVVRQGFRFYSGGILKRNDHRGKPYYWVGGKYKGFRRDRETDCYAVGHGYASLTPLHLDTTDYSCLSELQRVF
jgi:5'-nucleotidase